MTTIIVAAAVSAAVILTRGAAIEQQQELRDRLDESGSRVVRLIDQSPVGQLDVSALERIGQLDGVEWIVALGDSRDVTISAIPLGALVPTRHIVGDSPNLRTRSVDSEPCGAFVSRRAATKLGIDAATGSVRFADGLEQPICGSFEVSGPLDELSASVLVKERDWSGPVRTFVIGVREVADVTSVADAARAVSGAGDASTIRVELADQLLAVRGELESTTARFGRNAVLTVLGGGALVSALTAYLAVASRRRDFGRRRALGARRFQLFIVVVTQFASTALIGSLVGSSLGTLLLAARVGNIPSFGFLAAVSILTICAGVLGAIVPALVAANRDPLAVLRVP